MGLDMYLRGRKYYGGNFGSTIREEDGFPIDAVELALGYWRKHPNLHGFIVQTFAEGQDNCQEIMLNAENIKKIIEAVEQKALPMTDGFFFGQSDGSEQDEDLQIFGKALGWLAMDLDPPNAKPFMKYIVYQASW